MSDCAAIICVFNVAISASAKPIAVSREVILFCALVIAVSKSVISATVAKQVIIESYHIGQDPVIIAKNSGLIQVSDSGEIEKIAKQVIENNSKAVEDYKKNPASIGFLIGKLMQASRGSANPQLAKEILEKLLK